MKKLLLKVWNFLFDAKNKLSGSFFLLADFFYRHFAHPPKVMTNRETIDYIIQTRCSVSRYGDGELKLICGKMTAYEAPSAALTEDLKRALTEDNKQFFPCIPSFFSSLDGLTAQAASYWKRHLSRFRRAWYKNTGKNIVYGNAFISRFYFDYEDKAGAGKLFDRIKKIWDGREIILIEGGKSRLGYGNDLFAGASSVRRILVPLQELERGAHEVQQGNLSVRLSHEGKDEFTPALSAFNLMTEKLSASLREREEDEARRKELIASISHDIRTPLTAIRAYIEGLLDHVADTPEKEEHYLRVIEKKSEVLGRLIDQLQLLTKMDLGEKALTLVPLDLSRLVTNFIDENRILWEKQGADFRIESKGVYRMVGNTLLVERILENLITNSIRYKKEETVRIAVTVEAVAHEIHLSIADDGSGVPEEALARLTEAFYRTDLARSHTDKGSGLGLAIVKRAVTLMHGTLSVANRRPHGLLVQISFPKEERS